MIKVDLITGFLGAGKTTFLHYYVNYLKRQNLSVCILENDYGAINVDMMLLRDLEDDKCSLEMVSGSGDACCHQRRFKTKLIAMIALICFSVVPNSSVGSLSYTFSSKSMQETSATGASTAHIIFLNNLFMIVTVYVLEIQV